MRGLKSNVGLALSVILILEAGYLPKAMAYSQGQFREATTTEEAEINRIRDKEIDQLKIVMGRRFAESRKPEILLRLAELYIEKYRFYFFKENEIYQQAIKNGARPSQVGHSDSRRYLTASTNACLSILKSKVAFSKLDQVYYFLGYNNEEIGNRAEAQRYFKKVIERYPHSGFAPEAYRNLAEYDFDKKKYPEAIHYYEKAASYTQVPSYPRTLFKLAWAYFKTRHRSEALSAMKKVVSITNKDEKFLNLREEALNDLAMFYSEAGRFADASQFFKETTGNIEYYLKSLTRLSNVYENRGDYKQAAQINEGIIKEYGDEKPELVYINLMKNVELQKKIGNPNAEEKAISRMVDYFVTHKDQISKDEDGRAAFNRVKSNVRARAAEVHKLAQQKKDKKSYSRAADLYGIYIHSFLKNPDDGKEEKELSEILFYRTDCLLAADRESEAIVDLEKNLKSQGEEKYRREAGATLLNILIKKIDQSLKASNGKVPQALEEHFTSVSKTFEEVFPNDKMNSELRYKRARLAASKSGSDGLPKDATNALEELVEKYPSKREAADASRELINDLLKKNRREDAVALAKDYLKNGALLQAGKELGLKEYLQSVITRSSFEEVKSLEKNSDYAKAATEYEKIAEKSKSDSEVYFKSLNNAAVNYEKAGQLTEAFSLYQKLASSKNKDSGSKISQMAKAELKRIALLSLWKGNYAAATSLYQNLAGQNFYSEEEKFNFGKNAFSLAWGTSDYALAFSVANKVLHSSCAAHFTEACHELAMNAAQVLVDASRYEDVVAHLKYYQSLRVSGSRVAETNYRLAEAYQALHEDQKAWQYFDQTAQSYGKSKTKIKDFLERNYTAHAAFLQIEPQYKKFASIELQLPEDKMKQLTREKIGLLENMVNRYQNVVSLGDGEWGIASLERIYDAFYSFAEELEKTPIPERFQNDPTSKDQYRRGIKQVSDPMHNRGLENLNAGYKTGLSLDVTTPSFITLTQRLSLISKKQNPPAHYTLQVSDFEFLGKMPEDIAAARTELGDRFQSESSHGEAWVSLGNIEVASKRYRLARLLFEQALELNPNLVSALNNLGCIHLIQNEPGKAIVRFEKATKISEFSRAAKLNHAKLFLHFHHFKKAEDILRPLVARNPGDEVVLEAYAVSLLGAGNASDAYTRLNTLDASSKKRFNLWYNWAVASLLSGEKRHAGKAYTLLKDNRDDFSGLERKQIDVALSIFKGAVHED